MMYRIQMRATTKVRNQSYLVRLTTIRKMNGQSVALTSILDVNGELLGTEMPGCFTAHVAKLQGAITGCVGFIAGRR